MNEIIDNIENNNNIIKFNIKGIYNVDNFLVIHSESNCLLTDGDNVWDLKNYKKVQHVYKISNHLYVSVLYDGKQLLLDGENLEILYSQEMSYCSYIVMIDENYLKFSNEELGSGVYNLKTKSIIKPKDNFKFSFLLDDGLFVFSNNDLNSKSYLVVDNKGNIIYECNNAFPYKIGNHLVLHNKNKTITIVYDLFSNSLANKEATIEVNDEIVGEPQIYNGTILIVLKNEVKIINPDLEEIRSIPVNIDGKVVHTQLEFNTLIIVQEINNSKSCVIVLLNNDKVLYHDGVVVLPFDGGGRKTLRFFDSLNLDERKKYPAETFGIFGLIDEAGNEYIKKLASDAWIIESEKNNKFLFRNVNCEKYNEVFNIDTLKTIKVPYDKIEYNVSLDSYGWLNYGYAHNNQTDSYDFIDEDLNVLFGDINLHKLDSRYYNFNYQIINELLIITLEIGIQSRTLFRKIILDKEKNIIYDKFNSQINIIGSFVQINDEDGLKYLNSKTKDFSNDKNLLLSGFIPKKLLLSNNIVEFN